MAQRKFSNCHLSDYYYDDVEKLVYSTRLPGKARPLNWYHNTVQHTFSLKLCSSSVPGKKIMVSRTQIDEKLLPNFMARAA